MRLRVDAAIQSRVLRRERRGVRLVFSQPFERGRSEIRRRMSVFARVVPRSRSRAVEHEKRGERDVVPPVHAIVQAFQRGEIRDATLRERPRAKRRAAAQTAVVILGRPSAHLPRARAQRRRQRARPVRVVRARGGNPNRRESRHGLDQSRGRIHQHEPLRPGGGCPTTRRFDQTHERARRAASANLRRTPRVVRVGRVGRVARRRRPIADVARELC